MKIRQTCQLTNILVVGHLPQNKTVLKASRAPKARARRFEGFSTNVIEKTHSFLLVTSIHKGSQTDSEASVLGREWIVLCAPPWQNQYKDIASAEGMSEKNSRVFPCV